MLAAAAMMVVAAAVSAQNPPTGCRRVMPEPMVLTMRHPPNMVPRPMAPLQVRIIHHATEWVCPMKLRLLIQEPFPSGRWQ